MPPNPHLVEEPAILVIEMLNFISGQDQFNYTTHKNMYILLALITISPEIEANQCQTSYPAPSCGASKINYRVSV